MVIGDRLRELREEQNRSQGDIEKRTSLLRCYISRVENGHTVPAVETLEKFARALEVPVYHLFYEGTEQPADLPKRKNAADNEWGSRGKDARVLARFRRLLRQTDGSNRKLLLFMAPENGEITVAADFFGWHFGSLHRFQRSEQTCPLDITRRSVILLVEKRGLTVEKLRRRAEDDFGTTTLDCLRFIFFPLYGTKGSSLFAFHG